MGSEDTEVVSKPYRYFDTPDGEDILSKLWCVLKPAGTTALAVATIDVMMYSKPKGYLATLGRYAYIALPWVGMATTFVVVTNVAANLRGKQDMANWAAGGMAMGAIMGAWRRSPQMGWCSGMAFAGVGVGKKYAIDNNVTLLPKGNMMFGGALNVRHDYTLTAERERNWYK